MRSPPISGVSSAGIIPVNFMRESAAIAKSSIYYIEIIQRFAALIYALRVLLLRLEYYTLR